MQSHVKNGLKSLIVARFPTKGEAAAAAGVTVEQLNKWIVGSVKVPADGLKGLAAAANVDFSWLVAGDEAATDVSSGFTASLDISIIGLRVADLVVEIYRRNAVKMPDGALAREVVIRLSQLYKKADNPKDMEELFSLLPWLEKAIDRDVADARSDPGTGKRSAS